MKTRFFIAMLMAWAITASAQTSYEALRNSIFTPQGSARTIGVGGSIGAFGADFTTIYSNPAGIAAFRKADFTISPKWIGVDTKSQLQGGNPEENSVFSTRSNKLRLSNVGVVTTGSPASRDWVSVNFGMGLIRLADFDQRYYFEGISKGSITGRFIELADGLTPDELDNFEAGLAYETGAIYHLDPNEDNTVYTSDFTPTDLVPKGQSVSTRGGISELNFALAANYKEKLLIGVNLGIPFLRYNESKSYFERDENNDIKYFNELTYDEELNTIGTGFNLKLGLIFKPVHMLRFGVSVHTPTFFKLSDTYSSSMSYDYTYGGTDNFLEAESSGGYFEYKLRTPWRFIASGGVLIKKLAFLTAEAEWVDYSSSSYTFKNASTEDLSYEQELNRQIAEDYTSALALRFGGELRFGPGRARLGYSTISSPYANFNNTSDAIHMGLGIRTKKFYLDFAYVLSTYAEAYFPYETALYPKPEINNQIKRQDYVMTFGFKF